MNKSSECAVDQKLVFAVCGYGYWGPNIVRNLKKIGCEVKYIFDGAAERCDVAKEQYPECITLTSLDPVITDDEVDAVVIVLPVSLHYKFAKRCLNSGKHVLVEKPICTSSKDAEELMAIADSKGLVLMVDHTYVYSPFIEYLRDHYRNQHIMYLDSERINLGKYQRDVNVVWDLAVHDLSIFDYICESKPISLRAIGESHTSIGLEDIVTIVLHYPGDTIANIRVSWMSPVKSRRLIIGGNSDMAVFDDTLATDKIRIYESRIIDNAGSGVVLCEAGESYSPMIESEEVLSLMLGDFAQSIITGNRPRSDSSMGLRVVRLIEAIQTSLSNGGSEVELNVQRS